VQQGDNLLLQLFELMTYKCSQNFSFSIHPDFSNGNPENKTGESKERRGKTVGWKAAEDDVAGLTW
jgi:hypothetical protein